MQTKDEILVELRQLSMVIAGIDRQMPFGVPDGYFAEFPGKMQQLLQQGAEDQDIAPQWSRDSAFSVPTGYFEGFAANLMNRIKASTNLPGLGESFSAREELAGLSSLLSSLDKKMPYQTPEGYFEDLSAISPALTDVKDKATYEVPDSYFETLPEMITARVRPARTPAKVIPMRRSTRRTWWQYSAAAVVVGFIFTIGWLRLHTPTSKPGMNGVDVTQGLVKVSDQDIESYLDNQDNHTSQLQQDEDAGNSIASLEFSDNDIKSFLGDISDNELKQYMEEHGDLKDYPTN
jgi:hypothetical protein